MHVDLSSACFTDLTHRPDAPAVIGADRTLTWQQLHDDAHAWAARARVAGLTADVPVAIYGHKEAAFFVAMVGCLLAGLPFVPIDTLYPRERMLRVVEIARTLIGEPRVVLLDEPAVGLSMNRLAEFDALLRRIRDEKGVAMILIEHVIRLVMDVCDRVTVLNSGQRIAEGTPEEVRSDRQVIEAYLGKELRARHSEP